MKRCANCHKELALRTEAGLDTVCPSCAQPLHTCFNCHHYSPDARWQCLQPRTDGIKDKRGANGCERFTLRDLMDQRKDSVTESGRRKWDDLFPGL